MEKLAMSLTREDNYFSGIMLGLGVFPDGLQDKSADFGNPCCFSGELGSFLNHDKTEKVSSNIVDSLPMDPFGMDTGNKIAPSITEWIEDFGLKNIGSASVENEAEIVDDQIVAEVNIVWNTNSSMISMKTDPGFDFRLLESPLLLNSVLEDVMGFSCDGCWDPPQAFAENRVDEKNNLDAAPAPPPDALYFVLGYLDVKDLLYLESVCKSFYHAIRTDSLLWRDIQIDYPLSNRIGDDALFSLTERAQGHLHSLSLVRCLKITNNGLRRVLEANTRLTKLNVSGCLRVSIEGLIDNLKFFKSVGKTGIKCLRVAGLFGVTHQHFEKLKLLLSMQNQKLLKAHKPRFYQRGQLYISFDDDRSIDIDTCPRCQQVRQVYDCPTDGCRGKRNTPQACRACTFCISRCTNCGCCLSNREYEETFCLEMICLDCWKQILNCQEKQKRFAILPKHPFICQHSSYHFFCYG